MASDEGPSVPAVRAVTRPVVASTRRTQPLGQRAVVAFTRRRPGYQGGDVGDGDVGLGVAARPVPAGVEQELATARQPVEQPAGVVGGRLETQLLGVEGTCPRQVADRECGVDMALVDHQTSLTVDSRRVGFPRFPVSCKVRAICTGPGC